MPLRYKNAGRLHTLSKKETEVEQNGLIDFAYIEKETKTERYRWYISQLKVKYDFHEFHGYVTIHKKGILFCSHITMRYRKKCCVKISICKKRLMEIKLLCSKIMASSHTNYKSTVQNHTTSMWDIHREYTSQC